MALLKKKKLSAKDQQIYDVRMAIEYHGGLLRLDDNRKPTRKRLTDDQYEWKKEYVDRLKFWLMNNVE